jgi:glycosyltransferase involved in cell wall biosynthesis
MARLLRARLRRGQFDLAYSNTITNGVVHDLLRQLQVPILTHVHEMGYWMSRMLHPSVLNRAISQTDLFIACSSAVRCALVSRAVPASKVSVVHSFIDTASLSSPGKALASTSLRARLGLSERAVIVGGSGTIGWRKGTDLFVQVAVATVRERPSLPVHFVWFGAELESGDIARLRHDALLGGVDSKVSFAGHLDDAAVLLAGLDVFLLTSREDPFPLVMLEAAAGMTPMVAFSGTGGAEEFAAGGAGIVVPALDTNAMARAIVELLEDHERRHQIAAAAKLRVEREFDLQVAAPRILRLMQQVANPSAVTFGTDAAGEDPGP